MAKVMKDKEKELAKQQEEEKNELLQSIMWFLKWKRMKMYHVRIGL